MSKKTKEKGSDCTLAAEHFPNSIPKTQFSKFVGGGFKLKQKAKDEGIFDKHNFATFRGQV